MAKEKKDETIPALVVTPAQAPAVGGNFEDIKKYLAGWKKKVLAMEMSESNMEEVRTIKKEAVMYRGSLAEIQSSTKKLYFNDPKAVFDAKMGELLAVVADVEKAANGVLAVEEQERIDGINRVLNYYIEEFQKTYQLDDQHYAHLELRKDYYNKTVPKGYPSMDKYWKEQIEAQFKELQKSQKAHAANLRLIDNACKGDPRLNVTRYQHDLDARDVASVLEDIEAEKQRLRDLDIVAMLPTAASSTNIGAPEHEEFFPDDKHEKITLGVPPTIDFDTDFPGRTKSMRVEITYPCDLGDALTELFEGLKEKGIRVKRLVEEPVF